MPAACRLAEVGAPSPAATQKAVSIAMGDSSRGCLNGGGAGRADVRRQTKAGACEREGEVWPSCGGVLRRRPEIVVTFLPFVFCSLSLARYGFALHNPTGLCITNPHMPLFRLGLDCHCETSLKPRMATAGAPAFLEDDPTQDAGTDGVHIHNEIRLRSDEHSTDFDPHR